MIPLPDLPDRDEGPDPTADRALWSLVFIGLGTLIAANRPIGHAGWWVITVGVAYAAAAYFMFLLLVRKDR